MRKLGALTGIDTATISRIVNGKQKARLDHLQKFSEHLSVPIEKLFKAAGIDVEKETDESYSDIHAYVDSIKEVLISSRLLDHQYTLEHVRKELAKYEQYALTEEGHSIILDGFHTKVDGINGAGPFIDQLKNMYELYCEENSDLQKRSILGSALLYFIMSADIIPDYVFPFGYLDDAIAVQLVLHRLSQTEETENA